MIAHEHPCMHPPETIFVVMRGLTPETGDLSSADVAAA